MEGIGLAAFTQNFFSIIGRPVSFDNRLTSSICNNLISNKATHNIEKKKKKKKKKKIIKMYLVFKYRVYKTTIEKKYFFYYN